MNDVRFQNCICDLYETLGAHPANEGYSFAVWVPGVKSVSVAGSFNDWDTAKDRMTPGKGNVWTCFVPEARQGDLYKYVIETWDGRKQFKADPFAFYAQQPPETASVLYDIRGYAWKDRRWMQRKNTMRKAPLNIYEVHAGSWKRKEDGGYLSYRELQETLLPYVKEMGYTHIELLPMMEFPFDGSWGYQLTGYYAATSRFGEPKEFMAFIDACHQQDIGVILDWVPGHFCKDEHGLARFNGERLYESEDHPQWGTCRFDFGREEVCNFLLSNAFFWLKMYHADGIRVDGVTSMLYLNFGREEKEQKKYNRFGTEIDLDAKDFLQCLNQKIGAYDDRIMMIAEESTAFPLVTYPPAMDGLGFHYKWDMGWMHDTLHYMQTDFPFRPGNHNLLTFSLMYFYSENFILALSHDEVVHGKCSLIQRMPGDYWRQFAGMRALALYQMCHPGAKMNFMGNEIAQFIEWRYYEGIEYFLTGYESHAKHQQFIRQLNRFYREEKALWQKDYDPEGFRWLDPDDTEQSTLLFRRRGDREEDDVTVLLNFAPETYEKYRIGVEAPGDYEEIFNSDRTEFGGSGRINADVLRAEEIPMHGMPYSVTVRTPPVGGLVIKKKQGDHQCFTTKENSSKN